MISRLSDFSGFSLLRTAVLALAPLAVHAQAASNDPAPYCAPLYSSTARCTYNQLAEVSLEGTGLYSARPGCNLNSAGQPYANFAPTGSATATVEPGRVYRLTARGTDNYVRFSAWVDWNQNQVFDAEEWTSLDNAAVMGFGAANLRVPVNALPGTTRMRVRSGAYAEQRAAGACTSWSSGEAEDFTITVSAGPGNNSRPGPYCAAPHSNGCGQGSIQTVEWTGPGGYLSSGPGPTGCVADTAGNAYYHFPAAFAGPGYVQAGQTYSLRVETDPGQVVAAWIDWDGNRQFDASEWMQLNPTGAVTALSVLAPATAAPGVVRLRIRSCQGTAPLLPADACASLTSGETEDYDLTVLPAPTGPTVADPAPYCAPSNSGNAFGTQILRVRLVGTGLDQLSTTGNATAGSLYTNYSGLAATPALAVGQVYELQVQTAREADVLGWIDWDGDQQFETNEFFPVNRNERTGSILITIPNGATLGTTRLRLRSGSASTSSSPPTYSACGVLTGSFVSWGETEDYALTLVAGSGNANDPAPYCATPHNQVTPQGGGCGYYGITRVAIAGLLNSASGCTLDAAGNNYALYPASGPVTANLRAGQTYYFNIVTGGGATSITRWIDWNRNNVFDSSERTDLVQLGSNIIVSLAIPSTAVLGPIRMRLRTGSTSPCARQSTGESEDYVFNIVGNCTLAAPTLTPSATTLCAGTPLTLSATGVPAGATYQWTGPNNFNSTLAAPTIASPTVTASGIYSLTVVSATGCAGLSTVNITVNPSPATNGGSIGSPFLCPGDTVVFYTANGLMPIPGYTYLWSNGATTPTIKVGAAGSFTALVTNAAGCTARSMVFTATMGNAPTPTLSQTPVSGGVLLSTGLPTSISHQWYRDGTWLQGPSSPSYLATVPGRYQVRILQNSCYSLLSVASVVSTPSATQPRQLEGYTLAPNPTADGRLTLTQPNGARWADAATLSLYTALGQQLRPLPVPAGSSAALALDLHDLPAGLYFLQLTLADGRSAVWRFVRE